MANHVNAFQVAPSLINSVNKALFFCSVGHYQTTKHTAVLNLEL